MHRLEERLECVMSWRDGESGIWKEMWSRCKM